MSRSMYRRAALLLLALPVGVPAQDGPLGPTEEQLKQVRAAFDKLEAGFSAYIDVQAGRIVYQSYHFLLPETS